MSLERARLIELDQAFEKEKDGGRKATVQFNPETMKVTFANQLVQPQGGDQAAGNSGRQFVGAGTTKLALQLWFDVTAMEKDAVDDVRRLTQDVVYFMTPQKSDQDPNKLAPPGVRFHWGSFLFDGMVEALEESLEFFSPEGKPLRASISLTLSQQKILVAKFDDKMKSRPGQAPLKSAKQGESLQNMAGKNGRSDWQGIAEANGIEDPLRMSPGQLVNMELTTGAGFGAGAGVGASVGVGAAVGAGASATTSLNASLGGGAGDSITFG